MAEFWEALQSDKFPRPEGTERQESEEWHAAARRMLDSKLMKVEAESWGGQAEATLKRLATAKTTVGGGVKAQWIEVKPRWEVIITAESEAARDKILKAVNPLDGKAGVKKITQRAFAPSLWFKVSKEGEPD